MSSRNPAIKVEIDRTGHENIILLGANGLYTDVKQCITVAVNGGSSTTRAINATTSSNRSTSYAPANSNNASVTAIAEASTGFRVTASVSTISNTPRRVTAAPVRGTRILQSRQSAATTRATGTTQRLSTATTRANGTTQRVAPATARATGTTQRLSTATTRTNGTTQRQGNATTRAIGTTQSRQTATTTRAPGIQRPGTPATRASGTTQSRQTAATTRATETIQSRQSATTARATGTTQRPGTPATRASGTAQSTEAAATTRTTETIQRQGIATTGVTRSTQSRQVAAATRPTGTRLSREAAATTRATGTTQSRLSFAATRANGTTQRQVAAPSRATGTRLRQIAAQTRATGIIQRCCTAISPSTTGTMEGISATSIAVGVSGGRKKSDILAPVTDDSLTFFCSICFNNMITLEGKIECSISCLKCGHIFCTDCIVKWHSMKKICPLCYKFTTKRDIKQIFVPTLPLDAATSVTSQAVRSLSTAIPLQESGRANLMNLLSPKTSNLSPAVCKICCQNMKYRMMYHNFSLSWLACGHVFCTPCIVHWLNEKKFCPQCVKIVKPKDVKPLFI